MIDELATNLVNLKKEFAKNYDGKSQIQEVIPISKSELFPVPQRDLELLHQFAEKNSIYYNSYEKIIGETLCIVYEGDINKYWLNSIKHSSSCQPFYPTWMMSAYVMTLVAKKLGYAELVGIGSGDGRIAFCAKVLDLESYSIEIDDMLVDLQKLLTILNFHPYCSDAVTFDYSSLNLIRPIFFIGGIAQMGGTALASGVLEKINSIPNLKNVGWVFAGPFSQKYPPDPKNEPGWGTLIEKNNLKDRIQLKGRLSHSNICYYYNTGSILFHIGASGGLPNVVIEGIASGIPVIASENNASSDFVNRDLKTGIIIKAGDKIGLKNAIKEIIETPENFSGEVPQVIKEFSFERYGEKLEILFKKSLEEMKKHD